ncbi:UNVERIFIED_CONTAM: hypothetical protein NCL1_34473 [Trichonephila clavipes]
MDTLANSRNCPESACTFTNYVLRSVWKRCNTCSDVSNQRDRLLGIVFPFSRRLSRGQAWVIVVATWVAAMMCASPTAIWRWLQTRKWHDYEEVRKSYALPLKEISTLHLSKIISISIY